MIEGVMLKSIFDHPFFWAEARLHLLHHATPDLVQTDPFPHLILTDPLDASIYERLEKDFPPVRLIRSAKHVDHRDQITAPELLAHPEISSLWKRFARLHTSSRFFQKLVSLFGPQVRAAYPWFEEEMGRPLPSLSCGLRDPQAKSQPDIGLDCQPGLNVISLEPASVRTAHLDANNKLFTGLFYMKSDDDDSEGGDFLLYRPKKIPPTFDSPTTIPKSELEIAKRIPYRKNVAVFFLNSPHSIHGVSVRSGTAVPRRLVNLVAGCYRLPRQVFFPSPPDHASFLHISFAR